jgi:hypothetical protein
LPESLIYALQSSFLLSSRESVPEVAPQFKEPETKQRKCEEVVKSTELATVWVLVC